MFAPRLNNSGLIVDIGSRRPYKPLYFASENKTLACITPFASPPLKSNDFHNNYSHVERKIWIDLNVLIDAGKSEKDPLFQQLVEWSTAWNVPLDFDMAIYEKYRSSGVDPFKFIVNDLQNIRHSYGVPFDDELIALKCQLILGRTILYDDFANLTNIVVLIRWIFHKTIEFDEKCKMLADYMMQEIIPSTTAFLVACLFFHVKEQPDQFKRFHKKLVFTDLAVSGDSAIDRTKAQNIASDIGMLTYASWPVLEFPTGGFPVISVATKDKVLAFLLKEVCFYELHVVNGVAMPTPAYRFGGQARQTIEPIVKSFQPQFAKIDQSDKDKRSLRTKEIAEKILAGEHDLV